MRCEGGGAAAARSCSAAALLLLGEAASGAAALLPPPRSRGRSSGARGASPLKAAPPTRWQSNRSPRRAQARRASTQGESYYAPTATDAAAERRDPPTPANAGLRDDGRMSGRAGRPPLFPRAPRSRSVRAASTLPANPGTRPPLAQEPPSSPDSGPPPSATDWQLPPRRTQTLTQPCPQP